MKKIKLDLKKVKLLKEALHKDGWVGFDLDGTLAYHDEWKGISFIGEPILPMINKVKEFLNAGKTVKIFTARAENSDAIPYIEDWCKKHIGVILPITNVKDLNMEKLYDDRAVAVKQNTGVQLNKALPSPAQAKAGNYKKEHLTVDGLKITIENPKGSVRKGTDKEGNAWESTMEDHYGYILGVKGKDGDFLDCFINGDNSLNDSNGIPQKKVYIIKQVKKEDGSFDENKVMLGYATREEAQNAYLRNYDPSWFQLDSMEELTFEDFKNSIQTGYLKLEKSMKLIKCSDKLIKSMGRLTDLIKANGWGGAREGAGRPPEGGSDISEGKESTSSSGSKVEHSSKTVGFTHDPWKYSQFKDAPRDGYQDMLGNGKPLNDYRAALKEAGILNPDGRTVDLYHVTLADNEDSISNSGLIPGKEEAPGQNWKAKHSSYATYFHTDPEVALENVRSAVGDNGDDSDYIIVKATIPVTPKTMVRMLPDEDFNMDNTKGKESLKSKEPVAFIGGVPPSNITVIKNPLKNLNKKLEKSMKLKKVKLNKESVKKVNTSMEKLKKLCSTKKDK